MLVKGAADPQQRECGCVVRSARESFDGNSAVEMGWKNYWRRKNLERQKTAVEGALAVCTMVSKL